MPDVLLYKMNLMNSSLFYCVFRKLKDAFYTIDTERSGKLSYRDVSIANTFTPLTFSFLRALLTSAVAQSVVYKACERKRGTWRRQCAVDN